MTTILNGVLGGLSIGVVAALLTRFVADDPSATTILLESVVGTDVPSSRLAEFVVRLLYGGLAGGAFVALELFVLGILAIPPPSRPWVSPSRGALSCSVASVSLGGSLRQARSGAHISVNYWCTISSTGSDSVPGYGRRG